MTFTNDIRVTIVVQKDRGVSDYVPFLYAWESPRTPVRICENKLLCKTKCRKLLFWTSTLIEIPVYNMCDKLNDVCTAIISCDKMILTKLGIYFEFYLNFWGGGHDRTSGYNKLNQKRFFQIHWLILRIIWLKNPSKITNDSSSSTYTIIISSLYRYDIIKKNKVKDN